MEDRLDEGYFIVEEGEKREKMIKTERNDWRMKSTSIKFVKLKILILRIYKSIKSN